ncbi:MAG TPA: rod shape-determining protein MreC, partial [Gammaproteobacteria bacterium]|nr:rod shape-determining protein MreC [Gammaproteobacteria bacterium]
MASTDSKSVIGGRSTESLALRYLLLVLVCFAVMLLDHRQDHVSRVRQAVSIVVYPIQIFVDLPFRVGTWAIESLTQRASLLEENRRLDDSLRDAELELQQLEALRVENVRLRELLEASERLDDRRLVAEILSVDLDPYRQRFMVNRGGSDGVFVGQAVLNRYGVVGQVVSVGQWTAEVVLITDADHALPVVVNRSGLRTIAVGTGDQQRLRLPYLTNTSDIEVGDLLVSSGLGEVFPAGYPVARVLSMQTLPGQAFAEVVAEPVSALD